MFPQLVTILELILEAFHFPENAERECFFNMYVLGLPTNGCYAGVSSATVDRWKKILEIKAGFEQEIGASIYKLLPGVEANSIL